MGVIGLKARPFAPVCRILCSVLESVRPKPSGVGGAKAVSYPFTMARVESKFVELLLEPILERPKVGVDARETE